MEDFYRFGPALEGLRREQGVSVAALATALEVSAERVEEWERGGEPPTVAQMERVLEILQVGRGALIQWMERLEIERER